MNQNPQVSIILPTYNRASLLPRAIASIGAPDPGGYEVIVVDDGSMDDTASVLEGLQRGDIRLVRNGENRGIGYSRATGVKAARGELVAFLDSDDLWLPGKMELQIALFEKYPQLEFIFGNFLNRNLMEGTEQLGFDQNTAGMQMLKTRQLGERAYQILLGLAETLPVVNFIGTSSVMLRVSVFDKIGNFNEGLSGPEDFEFWWRAAAMGITFGYTTTPLSVREKGDSSVSGDGRGFLPRMIRALEICEATAVRINAPEYLGGLRRAKHRAWRGLVREYALSGERKEAIVSFLQATKCGFSLEAVKYVAAALAGPGMIQAARSWGIR